MLNDSKPSPSPSVRNGTLIVHLPDVVDVQTMLGALEHVASRHDDSVMRALLVMDRARVVMRTSDWRALRQPVIDRGMDLPPVGLLGQREPMQDALQFDDEWPPRCPVLIPFHQEEVACVWAGIRELERPGLRDRLEVARSDASFQRVLARITSSLGGPGS
jgi:hypothetical protein